MRKSRVYRKVSGRLYAIFIVTLLFGVSQPVFAQGTDPLTLDVRAGFDGYLQADTWNPVSITASNTGDDVAGDLTISVDGLGGGRTIYSRPIDLPRGSRKQVTLYPADLPSFASTLRIELSRRGRVLASQEVSVQYVTATTLLVGLLSDVPQSLADIGAVKPSSRNTRTAILTVDDIPSSGRGMAALDVLVISDVDTGKFSGDQQAALRSWVDGGGRLILVGGPSYQPTLAGVSDLSPLLPNGTADASLDALGSEAGSPFGTQVDTSALITTGTLVDGAHVLIEAGGAPLLVGQNSGYGRVDFLAADPALEPLRSWDGMPALWFTILASGDPRPGWAFGFISDWTSARDAAAAVPGVRLPSVIQLCGFLFLYVVLIGPVNYFVLWRMKRRELAWLTIPALIVLFSLIAYLTGFQLRGSQVIVNRLGVVHSWAGRDEAEVQALIGVWSPRRTRYDIAMGSGFLARPLPSGFSGALTTVGDTIVEQSDTVTLRGVQVDVGSVKPFVVEGYSADSPRIDGSVEVVPGITGLHLVGDVVNSGTVDLKDVAILAGGESRRLDSLSAGEVLHIDLVMGTGQMIPGGSGIDPYPNTGNYGYYGYVYDPVISNIVGTDECYSSMELQARCNLVTSIMASGWHGTRVVLTGWSDALPVPMEVLNANSRLVDQALYFIELDSAASSQSQTLDVIPPGLMTWQLLEDSTGYFSSPYDFYLYSGGEVAFRFQPLSSLVIPEIDSIQVNLESSYGGAPRPTLHIYNFRTGAWDTVSVVWGSTQIADAADYVDALGGVQVSLTMDDMSEATISRFDVTLYGK